MKYFPSVILVAVVFILPIFSGCGGKQATMRYYQLAPMELSGQSVAEKMPDLVLGVGPVSIPEALKRQEIVIRGKDNQYHLDDLHRWVGLLEKDLTAVLIENLGNLLGTEQVISYPWGTHFTPDYRVLIEVLNLTGHLGGQVTLRVSWTIVDRSGEKALVRKISEYHRQASDKSFDSLIQSQNQLIALLCQEINSTLRLLEK